MFSLSLELVKENPCDRWRNDMVSGKEHLLGGNGWRWNCINLSEASREITRVTWPNFVLWCILMVQDPSLEVCRNEIGGEIVSWSKCSHLMGYAYGGIALNSARHDHCVHPWVESEKKDCELNETDLAGRSWRAMDCSIQISDVTERRYAMYIASPEPSSKFFPGKNVLRSHAR